MRGDIGMITKASEGSVMVVDFGRTEDSSRFLGHH